MNSVKLEHVLNIVKFNKDKLYMKEYNNHQLNHNNINKLYENINNHSCLSNEKKELTIKFLKKLFDVFIYIPFDKYMTKLKSISNEIQDYLLTNHGKYDIIYYIADDVMKKSNTWILFLFLNEMFDFYINNREILNKIEIVNDCEHINFNIPNLILTFDDMSYSGTQLATTISSYKFNKNNKTDFFITTCYISKTAIQRIKNENHNKYILYWKNIEEIPTLRELFNDDNLINEMCQINSFASKSIQCLDTLIPIYFDHKIADHYSTFQKLLIFGTYPINNENCEPICINMSLINNCSITNISNKNLCSTYIVDDLDICPKTFYKTFKYEYYENNINDNIIDDFEYDDLKLVQFIDNCINIKKYKFNLLNSTYNKYMKYKYKYNLLRKKLNN
jgi:hypothetical protein